VKQDELRREILSLKEELEKTRHRLLQYEIFDKNSDVDIQALLGSVHSNSDNEDDEDQNDDKTESWEFIENCIKIGKKSNIDKLIKYTKISMDESEEINCFKMLEAATRYNQIDIVHKIISSYIGVKLGNKLLCHRYDEKYSGYTILMISVINGYVEIANDLLDYYEYNAINYNDKNKLFEYLNMKDRNGVTLLMKACQSDKVKTVQWVLNQYFNNKVQLKILIEAKDNAGNDIFSGYIQSQNIENCIQEYSPLIH